MWEACGAEVIETTIKHHDEVLAATSHLPHMLAYSLVDTLAKMDAKNEIFDFAAGGFRDFTRIASSDPTMWRDVALSNQGALLEMMEQFETFFAELKEDVRKGDIERLFEFFVRSKQLRDAIL